MTSATADVAGSVVESDRDPSLIRLESHLAPLTAAVVA